MSTETNKPLWGCPWHGVIRREFVTPPPGISGDQYLSSQQTMMLPSGAEMPWPQSSDIYTSNIAHHGTVFMQRLPGAAQSTETSDEQAADGMDWRNYALVSGGFQSEVHGKRLGNLAWFYWDATMGWPWKLNLSVRRIDSINAFDCETYDLTVSADPSGFVLKPWPGFDKTVRLSAEQTAEFSRVGWQNSGLRYCIVDAVADGSKIIIGVYNALNRSLRERSDSMTVNDVTALGFWLLEVAGSPFAGGLDFDLQATELATRTACLGSVNYTPMPTGSVTVNVYSPNDLQGFRIDSPPGPYPEPSSTPLPIVSRSFSTTEEIGVETRRLLGKVVGYWFDDQGEPAPVVINRVATRERSSSYSEQIVDNSLVMVIDSEGATTYEGSADGEATRTVVEINIDQIEVSWAGHALVEQCTHTRTVQYDWHYQAKDGYFPPPSAAGALTVTYTVEMDSPAGHSQEGPTTQQLGSASAPNGLPAAASDSSAAAYECSLDSFPTLMRWCDKAFGVVCRANSSEIGVSRVLTPGGKKGAAGTHPVTNKYGAYQPVTGEVLIAERNPVRFT
ncbi:hypothetical protein EF096_01960 [Pseudomonas neustonica]|uniref:Tip attachment protein J domain-containing protein n=1 Tax=Pseudomonas neustonica TaxID=2487346 RepID=A0ABX9XN83_9PSED|nr:MULTISPECIES: hypothetical protein [Pseudomonas]ROZ86905.1 hypothetical protein EF099_00740 [Pseudomonas sp. SSM44]ROZ88479.1 hypothetical protein EF096_01960 [Pseudomonas neustonica]